MGAEIGKKETMQEVDSYMNFIEREGCEIVWKEDAGIGQKTKDAEIE